MSTDRTAELLNYMSAFSRDFGEFRQEFKQHRQEFIQHREEFIQHRQEFKQFREETNTRLDKVEREVREMRRSLDIVGSGVLAQRAKIDELDERVTGLEGKRA